MSAPEGLTALEYARHILEFSLGWPARGNLELIADCITSVSKAKTGGNLVKAHSYMERAISLAKQQSIDLDRFFFMEGRYANVRPAKSDVYDLEAKRQKASEEHGCSNGWVYAEKGVVRCQKCVRK